MVILLVVLWYLFIGLLMLCWISVYISVGIVMYVSRVKFVIVCVCLFGSKCYNVS